jgi:hypothetical protein
MVLSVLSDSNGHYPICQVERQITSLELIFVYKHELYDEIQAISEAGTARSL